MPAGCLSSRIVCLMVGLLFISCAILEFYPFDLLSMGRTGADLGARLSAFVSPLAMVSILALTYLRYSKDTIAYVKRHAGFVWVSLLSALCIITSALVNQLPDPRVILIAANFLVTSLFLLMLTRSVQLPVLGEGLLIWPLLAWVVIPLLVTPFETQDHFFLTCAPFTAFHGFTNGRLLFGFWSGCLVVMLAALFDRGETPLITRISFFIAYCAMVACQTRSAIGLATLAAGWIMLDHRKEVGLKLIAFALSFAAGLALNMQLNTICNYKVESVAQSSLKFKPAQPAALAEQAPQSPLVSAHSNAANTSHTLRAPETSRAPPSEYQFRAMDIKDPTRLEIYSRFIPATASDWLWGLGKMKLVSIPAIGENIQAHNIFLQTLANFGVFTLALLLSWCWLLLRLLKTTGARLLFAYFIGYSLIQPLFGGSLNFFAPRALLVLMLVIYFDHMLFNTQSNTPFNRTRRSS